MTLPSPLALPRQIRRLTLFCVNGCRHKNRRAESPKIGEHCNSGSLKFWDGRRGWPQRTRPCPKFEVRIGKLNIASICSRLHRNAPIALLEGYHIVASCHHGEKMIKSRGAITRPCFVPLAIPDNTPGSITCLFMPSWKERMMLINLYNQYCEVSARDLACWRSHKPWLNP